MLSSRTTTTTTTTNTKKNNNSNTKKQGKVAIVHSVRIAQQGRPLYMCYLVCHLAVLDGSLERDIDNEVYLEADLHLLFPLAVLFYNTFHPLWKVNNMRFDLTLCLLAFPPAAPVILNQEKQLSNRSFTLRWNETVDNGRPILRYVVFYRELYVNESKQKDASTNLYYDLTLMWAKTYEFTVVAENDQGRSKNSTKKNFTVIPSESLYIFIKKK